MSEVSNPAPMMRDLFDEDALGRYLAALEEGIPLGIAAQAVGLTGTKLRALRRRDPEFAELCADAMGEGRVHYQERLSAQARLRALQGSDRMLEVELATHVPGYEHLRRNRIEIDGRLENAIVMPPGWLESAPVELLVWLAQQDGAVIEDGEFRELAEGDDDGPPALAA